MSMPPRRLRIASTRAGSRGAASLVQSGMRKGGFRVWGGAGVLIKAAKIRGSRHPTGEVAEWSNAPDSKSGLRQRNGGSNPSLSARFQRQRIDVVGVLA